MTPPIVVVDVPDLTPQQIANLKERCNKLNPGFVAGAVKKGFVNLDELPLSPLVRTAIQAALGPAAQTGAQPPQAPPVPPVPPAHGSPSAQADIVTPPSPPAPPTQQQLTLRNNCNKLGAKIVAQAIAKGVDTLDNLPLTPSRRALVEEALRQMPDPQELLAWNAIAALQKKPQAKAELEAALAAYVAAYGESRPQGNHVDEASALLDQLLGEAERAKWDELDQTNYCALREFLAEVKLEAYRQQAEQAIWAVACKSEQLLGQYVQDFPQSPHAAEAAERLQALQEWERVRLSGSVRALMSYVKDHPASPFLADARALLAQKRDEVLDEMTANPASFPAKEVRQFLDSGLLTDQDLLDRRLLTPDVLRLLRNMPDLPFASMEENPDLQSDAQMTDVFFFGVPSSGKTCVLTGVLGSNQWKYVDLAAYNSAPYVNVLHLYRRHGIVPDRTSGRFVSLIKAVANDAERPNVTHPVNLVEMSGEEFATRIVNNREAEVNFEHMGTGATNLLGNNNRKVFFLVIDPSADGVLYIPRYDSNGNPVVDANGKPVRDVTSQDLILQRMVSMITAPTNAALLRKVDTIHFIVSKADMLGQPAERSERAVELCRRYYQQSINMLAEVCRKYGINSASNGFPMLHTFSLGHFYVGGLYEYDASDSDKLVKVISGVSQGLARKKGFLTNLGALFTK